MNKLGTNRKLLAIIIPVIVLLAGIGLFWWTHREPSTILYRDQELEVKRDVPRSKYDPDRFQMELSTGRLSYEKGEKKARLGIDVSYYQQEIDWEAVARDGVEFAIIRLGYRGYGNGALKVDARFEENYHGATQAGLEVGVYFFSQAITPWEAEEEASFLLHALKGRALDYPVIYDWEHIKPGENARTDHMTGPQITACATAFARQVEQGGYEPMIYFNPEMGYLSYDLSQLKDYPFWLARYGTQPDFYYDFDLWQFTHTGTVDGIEGDVDINLDMRPIK